jgi:hypothetical protein
LYVLIAISIHCLTATFDGVESPGRLPGLNGIRKDLGKMLGWRTISEVPAAFAFMGFFSYFFVPPVVLSPAPQAE